MTAHESLMSAVRDVLENYYVLEFDKNNCVDQVVWVDREKMKTLSQSYGEVRVQEIALANGAKR
jgi:hypothetical protein